MEMKALDNWEIRDNLRGKKKQLSMQTEWTVHRDADVVVEVGSAGSTRNLGKPGTWGSGGAE